MKITLTTTEIKKKFHIADDIELIVETKKTGRKRGMKFPNGYKKKSELGQLATVLH